MGRLVTIGYGPDKPVESNDTKAGRQKNRRIEFRLLREGEGAAEAKPATAESSETQEAKPAKEEKPAKEAKPSKEEKPTEEAKPSKAETPKATADK